ncbi:hypothetical protein [Nocardioides sp. NPDC047086]|uniref:hypothetical protein n=1 Tax=Nocardioides sp. NPDC047086 TaxID=3154810 RepID=UPI0033D1B464
MTAIKETLVSEYQRGLRESTEQAYRLYGVAVLTFALASGVLTDFPRAVIERALTLMRARVLSDDEIETLSDSLLDYLVAKNGSDLVRRDHEDRVVRASFEAFYPAIEYEGLEGCAADVEELMLGGGADFTIA